MSLEAAPYPPDDAHEYERIEVPASFDRYARDLVERARPIGASDRILDLGCGTGIVARVLRERLGGAASIVGVDASPPMIETARSIAPELDCREGNAMALPFADGSFDLVLCQEMLQFVADRMAALREVRRVLSPGGACSRARGDRAASNRSTRCAGQRSAKLDSPKSASRRSPSPSSTTTSARPSSPTSPRPLHREENNAALSLCRPMEETMTYAIDETLVAKARELGPLIREHAPEAERERRLSKPVIDALNRAGITKMLLPKSLGGLETDPVTMLRVVEEIASFDSVAGWLLMVSNSGAYTGARFPAETVEEIFRDPNDWFIGTAFQPPVEAREVEGGYRLTGQRALASFSHASRWIC